LSIKQYKFVTNWTKVVLHENL